MLNIDYINKIMGLTRPTIKKVKPKPKLIKKKKQSAGSSAERKEKSTKMIIGALIDIGGASVLEVAERTKLAHSCVRDRLDELVCLKKVTSEKRRVEGKTNLIRHYTLLEAL